MSSTAWSYQHLSYERPSLFHFPVGDAWWWQSPSEQAVLDTGTWLHRSGDSVTVHRSVSALDVLPSTTGLRLRPPEASTRQHHLWSHPLGPLPFGGARARRLWTSPCGQVRLWEDDFWLYRQRAGEPPEALGRVQANDGVLIGPHGAVLVSRGEHFAACASPTGPLQSIAVSTEGAWWGVRWSCDGREVALPGPESLRLDLHRAAPAEGPMWPANAVGTASLNAEQTELATPSGPVALPTCSPARLGALLAGPGGVSWDLTTGRRLFDTPVWRLGATVAVSASRFFTVHYESGAGAWVEPRTGEVLEQVQLPLLDDELVDEGWSCNNAALVALSSGRVLEVSGPLIREGSGEPPAPARRPRVRLPIPWDDGAQVGDHTWVWSEAGLLLALPAAG